MFELFKFYYRGLYYQARLSRNEGMQWILTSWVVGVGFGSMVLIIMLLNKNYSELWLPILWVSAGIFMAYAFLPMAKRIHNKRVKEKDPVLFENVKTATNNEAMNKAEIYLSFGRKKKAIEILEFELSKHPNNKKLKARLEKIKDY